jgi:hypothetical protein
MWFCRIHLATTVFLCVASSVVGPPTSLEAAAGQAPLPSDPVFQVQRTDGTSVMGRLLRFDANGEFVLQPEPPEESPVVLPLNQIVSLQRDGVTPPALPEGPCLLFPEGDRLRVVFGAEDEEQVQVQSPCLGPLRIPLANILAMVFTVPSESIPLYEFLESIRAQSAGQETLWLSNGDRLTGGFLGLNPEAIDFQTQAGPTSVPRKGVRALAFDKALVEYPAPDGPYLELHLTDGSRIAVSAPRYAQGAIEGRTRFGVPVRAPIGEVTRLTLRSGIVEYLSERPEALVKYVPYLGQPRPYRRDRAVDGLPLMLDGQPFDRGLGLQSRTLLAYKLDSSTLRFQARIGVDDRAGPLASVLFRVLLDGEEAYASPPMSSSDPAREIDLDIRERRILILEADFGERGDVRDFADWVDARLIRQAEDAGR